LCVLCCFPGSLHDFDDTEVKMLRVCMLDWYDKHRRDLPWRQMVCGIMGHVLRKYYHLHWFTDTL